MVEDIGDLSREISNNSQTKFVCFGKFVDQHIWPSYGYDCKFPNKGKACKAFSTQRMFPAQGK